jgi:hypothetical protein
MQQWGAYFAARGFTLRSGGALRADRAFELGCDSAVFNPGRGRRPKEIFTADMSAQHPEWFTHAALFHPAWDKCSPWARALHARNSAIMLGASLNQPVNFVCCWTKDGKASGGTGQALRIAERLHIPVFNWFFDDAEDKLRTFLNRR